MASITAAVCGAPAAFCTGVSTTTTTAARSQLGAPALKIHSKPLGWADKTVTNGSRVNAFNVVNPETSTHFETLSYLPPLTDEQLTKQVDYLLRNKLIPAIEFDKAGTLTRIASKLPTYYEGRYWTMWKLPLFGATDSSQVLQEVQECKKSFPDSFIRIIGFDNVRQVQVVSFIVHKPKGK